MRFLLVAVFLAGCMSSSPVYSCDEGDFCEEYVSGYSEADARRLCTGRMSAERCTANGRVARCTITIERTTLIENYYTRSTMDWSAMCPPPGAAPAVSYFFEPG